MGSHLSSPTTELQQLMGEQKQSPLWEYVIYSRRFFHLFLLVFFISLFTHCLKIQYSPLDTSQPGIAGIIALIAPILLEFEENSKEAVAPPFTLGGTVSGLSGTLVLTNGGVDKSITANGSYSFDLVISSGSSYNVTVKTQPTNVTCTVSNATGTITANVTNINVGCNCPGPDSPVIRNWGTFTDQCNGVVSLAVNAGTFGGQTYTAQTLTLHLHQSTSYFPIRLLSIIGRRLPTLLLSVARGTSACLVASSTPLVRPMASMCIVFPDRDSTGSSTVVGGIGSVGNFDCWML